MTTDTKTHTISPPYPLRLVTQALSEHPDVAAWVHAMVTGAPADARVSEPLLAPIVAAVHAARAAAGPAAGAFPLLVVPDDAEAERVAEAVGWYLGEERAAAYVARGVPYGAGVAPPAARIGAREHARQVARAGGVVVASVASLMELVPPEAVRSQPVAVRPGDTLDRDELVRRLVDAGYDRCEQAEERGQLAVRGDIVDVYATTARHPVRIEFFDDEIEEVRQYSAFTQRSLGKLDRFDAMPAHEVHDLASYDTWWGQHDEGDPILEAAGGRLEPALVALAPVHDLPLLVWDPATTAKELDEGMRELAAAHIARDGYVGDDELEQLLAQAVRLDSMQASQPYTFEAQPPVFGSLGMAEAEGELRGLVGRGLRVVVTFPHAGQAARTQERAKRADVDLLADARPGDFLPAESGAWFAVSLLASGFVSRQLGLAVVPSGRLFRQRPSATERGVGQSLAAFTSLRVGDFVVHEDHGIGRFAGFETKTVAGVTRDYLYIEFAGADRLYVPHEQMGKVTRYVGADGGAPALSRLGGKKWHNLKNRARTAVRELAGELLALYAKRARAVGHAFGRDDELMQQFELAFPYTETDDQLKAIGAVKEDMERPQPMDRLICGDVGFGKTEVAMRAAVKAVASGKQVMMLVPTTVLASQHLKTFAERLQDMPISVDMVSRFRTPKETNEVLERFRQGKLDVLVGTHRLLSRDVLPKELGLVIVDEEQRFGVAQKEMLRQLRLEVDTVALSATPIPRTLHMSLAGMRDITVIETPPTGRRPIHTHVGEYDEELVRMAIERELERDGQVFFLHNRVETIEETVLKVQQIVPEARVGMGHGQMGEKDLENVMLGFVRRDFDVLVATTIIESGLDIPLANTLIVDRADMLGLAQLYQIRGRVGRSSRSAHAYLFYPSRRELTEEARARLTTLSDFTDLGSGSRIAMRDLELRGAGNLLGAEQSGHVAAVGFELYVEMLAEAVSEMGGTAGPGSAIPVEMARGAQIDVRVDAYVPADYIGSEAIKIDVHRRIALARSEEQLADLVAELEDRFGEVPNPVHNLVALSELRLLMARIGADRLSVAAGKVSVQPVSFDTDDATRFRVVEPLAVYSSSRGEIQARVPEPTQGLARAKTLLQHVADVLEV